MDKILINGRFLGQKITGVQRFGREILRELDSQVGRGDLPAELAGSSFEVAVPSGLASDLNFSAISVKELPGGSGHFWEQVTLARYDAKAPLISLCNAGPLVRANHIAVVHDAAVFRMPASYGWKYRTFHRLISRSLARTAKIATVSEFSRDELSYFLALSPDKISVLGNSADHFRRVEENFSTTDKIKLEGRPFFLVIGSENKSKNIALIREAVSRREDDDWLVVVVGGKDNAVFQSEEVSGSNRFIYPGRLTDAEIAGLAKRAVALVFPSLYEGFGIPPLEAMILGCPVAASNIPPCREVCGAAARYFDPHDAEGLATIMSELAQGGEERQKMIQAGHAQSLKFTWSSVVSKLLSVLVKESGDGVFERSVSKACSGWGAMG